MSQNGTPVVALETVKRKAIGTLQVDGSAYEVLQLTFGQNQRLTASERAGEGYITTVHEIIGEVMPTLPQSTRDNLALPDGQIILVFAAGGVKAVEASFPNVVTPVDQTSAA